MGTLRYSIRIFRTHVAMQYIVESTAKCQNMYRSIVRKSEYKKSDHGVNLLLTVTVINRSSRNIGGSEEKSRLRYYRYYYFRNVLSNVLRSLFY